MSALSELEQAKILAAGQKLAEARINALREYIDSQIKQLQEQKLISGPSGPMGPRGERGPLSEDLRPKVRGPVGETGEKANRATKDL